MKQYKPIGIFDSGVGGLSVAREIAKQLPGEDLLYIADSQYAPYGEKSSTDIEYRALSISRYLIRNDVKALVVACNTATAFAIRTLRSMYPIPIIGIEPALKPAILKTRSGTIGILATTGTLRSEKFSSLNNQFGGGVRVITQPCPGLVEKVECGDLSGDETRSLVNNYVDHLIYQGADTLVLGCTHYPFLASLIQNRAGHNVSIIDTSRPVTRELVRKLSENKLLNPRQTKGSLRFMTSKCNNETYTVVEKLWTTPVRIDQLPDRYIRLGGNPTDNYCKHDPLQSA